MRFDYPDTFIDESFARKTHMHQSLIQLFGDVAVGPTDQTRDFLKVCAQKRITRAGITRDDDRVLVGAPFEPIKKFKRR